jgi:mono/diheme cytochrome c family protein
VTTENEEGREQSGRFHFAIGSVLGVAASVAVAVLLFIVVATSLSVKDAVSPPEDVAAEEPVTPGDLVSVGENLSAVCIGCHSTDGTDKVGPTWSGLSGSQRTFIDGSTVTADDPYILESIVDPGAKVVEGFGDGLMPGSFSDSFSADELDALVAYINSL